MKWLIPFLFILVGCNSVEPELGELNGVSVASNRPIITSFTVPSNGTYTTATPLVFSAVFSKTVTVFGTPRIQIITESGTYQALTSVAPGSQVTSMSFSYTPAVTDTDINGIQYSSSVVLGFGGSIYDATTGLDADLTLPHFNTASVIINSGGGSYPPGTGPDILSFTSPDISPKTGGIYHNGMRYCVTINFDEAVTVAGQPSIQILVDNISGAKVPKTASYFSGSGGTAIKFCRTVEYISATNYDYDLDGVEVDPADAVSLIVVGGANQVLRLSDGTNIDQDYTAPVGPFANTKLNGNLGPAFTGISTPVGIYRHGSVLTFTLNFDTPLRVANGVPVLDINIGGAPRQAAWVNDAGAFETTKSFTYPINDGIPNFDFDGVTVTGIDQSTARFEEETTLAKTKQITNAQVQSSSTGFVATAHALHWYDLGNLLTTTSNVSPLQDFYDILSGNDGQITGNIPYSNANKAITFTGNEYILLQNQIPTLAYVVLVINTQAGNHAGNILYNDGAGNSLLDFNIGNLSSFNCTVADPCRYLKSNGEWETIDSSATFPLNTSTAVQKKVIVVKYNNLPNVRVGIANGSTPMIYELAFLSGGLLEGQVKLFADHLAAKHGASY